LLLDEKGGTLESPGTAEFRRDKSGCMPIDIGAAAIGTVITGAGTAILKLP
jgi:hypothetical protein